MLFSAGIGIGLLYWGTAEPLYHFVQPPTAEPSTIESAKEAMQLSFLHWGGAWVGGICGGRAVACVFSLSPWIAIVDTLCALSDHR